MLGTSGVHVGSCETECGLLAQPQIGCVDRRWAGFWIIWIAVKILLAENVYSNPCYCFKSMQDFSFPIAECFFLWKRDIRLRCFLLVRYYMISHSHTSFPSSFCLIDHMSVIHVIEHGPVQDVADFSGKPCVLLLIAPSCSSSSSRVFRMAVIKSWPWEICNSLVTKS